MDKNTSKVILEKSKFIKISKIDLTLLSILQIIFSTQTSFADPSQKLLEIVSTRAVDARRNSMPTLLTDESKTRIFLQVIRDAETEMKKNGVPIAESDRAIFNCFKNATDSSHLLDCDGTVKELTQSLLFEAGDAHGGITSHFSAVNPSYNAIKTEFPNSILIHDTHKDGLIRMLSLGRIGKTKEEEFTDLTTNRSQIDELIDKFSYHLNGYAGTYVAWEPSKEAANTFRFYQGGGVRLILKPEVLKRWDFHITDDHAAGVFYREGDHDRRISYGPAQFRQFGLDFQNKRLTSRYPQDVINELIFHNPLQISDIKEIKVARSGRADLQQLIEQFKSAIPELGQIRITVADDEVAGTFRSLDASDKRCFYSQEKNSLLNLGSAIDQILSNPALRKQFESNHPDDRTITRDKLRGAIRSDSLSPLFPVSSLREHEYLTYGKKQLMKLKDDPNGRHSFDFFFNLSFKKDEHGNFTEPWMTREAELIKPIWEKN